MMQRQKNSPGDWGNKLTISFILLALAVYSKQLTVESKYAGYYQAGFITSAITPAGLESSLKSVWRHRKDNGDAHADRRIRASRSSLQGDGYLDIEDSGFQVVSMAQVGFESDEGLDFDDFDNQIPTPMLTLIGQTSSNAAGRTEVMSMVEQFLAMDEEAFELDPEDIPIPELPEDSGGGQEFTFRRVKMQRGQSLEFISASQGVELSHLLLVNGLAGNSSVDPGQEIIVPMGLGTLHRVESGDTLWSIGKKYNLKTATLLFFNAQKQEQQALHAGESLFIPLGVIRTTDAEMIAAMPRIRQILDNKTLFAWPVHGRLSSHFGWRNDPILHTTRMHKGLDVACPYGSVIKATERGRVVHSGWRGSGGITVIVEHPNGMHSIYAHCSKALVKPGQWVTKRQSIAKVGSTGRSTGAHLHFALKRKSGDVVNPLKFLDVASL